jgi:TonB family protein
VTMLRSGLHERWFALGVSITIHFVAGLLVWMMWDWTPRQMQEIPVELAWTVNPVQPSVEKTIDSPIQSEQTNESSHVANMVESSLQVQAKPENIAAGPLVPADMPKKSELLPEPQTSAAPLGSDGETGTVLLPPKLLHKPELVVPAQLLRTGFSGSVLLTIEVLENGRVGKVVLNRSSGAEVFDALARENVSQWNFAPARQPQGGKPVKVMTSVWVIYDAKERG